MSIRIILALSQPRRRPPFSSNTAPPVAAAPAPVDLVPVALNTAMGRIVIALDRGHAPKTVANFLAYVDGKKFDGETFYRAMNMATAGSSKGDHHQRRQAGQAGRA